MLRLAKDSEVRVGVMAPSHNVRVDRRGIWEERLKEQMLGTAESKRRCCKR